MKKSLKKGFTLVELVIVIAVIAILAAVLIPTFSGVVKKANISAAEQEARNNMTNDLVYAEADYANMLTYKSSDGKTQYYVVKSVTMDEANNAITENNTTVYLQVATSTSGTATQTYKTTDDFTESDTTGTTYTYYEVAAYNGVYTAKTDSAAAKWEDTVNGYTCTYNISEGTWTIEKK